MKAQTMKKHRFFPLALISVAVLAGCGTVPTSPTLADARTDYSNAQANPQVVKLAPLQLKEAGEALDRANAAQSARDDAQKVDSLAYVAKQKVALAQVTAQRKNAELEVSNAAAQRSKLQLEARTNEADQAKQQAAMAQQTVEQKNAQLAAKTAEADAARQQAANAQASAEQDKASLAALQAQMDELNAKKTARGMVITLGDVLFDTGKARLKSGGERDVQRLADFMQRYPERKVLIEGYTDSTGGSSYNQTLSEQRASAVGNALTNLGVSADRISTKGYGKAYPVASNSNVAGRQLNRRVEIVLSDDKGNIIAR
jgi:outer membrane protein OmpA-like peptidoglycan-associated protein